MTENLHIALQLLLVGMLSVFFILGVVVGLGKILISIVNKFSKDPIPKPMRATAKRAEFSAKKLAVLSAVVDVVSDGQGIIKSVKKINS